MLNAEQSRGKQESLQKMGDMDRVSLEIRNLENLPKTVSCSSMLNVKTSGDRERAARG